MEIAPEAIIFESEATLNKKRGDLKILHSVVVQPRFSAFTEIVPSNFGGAGNTMFRTSVATGPTSKKKMPLSSRSSSGKTSLNSTPTHHHHDPKKVRIGKPGLSVSYSWSDRRTGRKEEEEKSKKKKKSKKKGKRRRGRRRRKRKKREKSSSSSESDNNTTSSSKSKSRKWKNLMTPRRHRRRRNATKKKKQQQQQKKKKQPPPLPLYTNGGNLHHHQKSFPRNLHPVQIQFIEECPASVDLCVVFNSNTAVRKFPGVIDMSAKWRHDDSGCQVPFRTTGGCRRVHRAADRSCFDFSNEVSIQKKHYSHCFSVEFQVENVRYVSHFQEVDRVVVLWAKEINGLYHGGGGENDHNQTVTNVPVLLCLPHRYQDYGNHNVKEGIETMDLIICDAKSTAWSKNRNVQLFPVRQIKAADIQTYMTQPQRNGGGGGDADSQSSCSDAISLTRKKKRQTTAAAAKKDPKKKKKRSRSRFGWLPRLRSLEKEVIETPIPAETTQASDEESVAFRLAPPPNLDLAYWRTVSKGVHPGLSSVEHSPRGPFVLTDSIYSISSSPSPSISSSSQSISQPSSPSGDTTATTAVSHTATSEDYTSGSSWFTDSQAFSSYEEDIEEEEAESSSYIRLPKDSAGRIISDSIETASSISGTSSAATNTSSSWNQARRHHHHRRRHQKKKKKVKIPILNLQATTMTAATSPLASPRSPRPSVTSQRDRLLEGIAQKMQKEIQKTENPHKTSPRLLLRRLPLDKINVDQGTTETSSSSSSTKDNGGYNALLSPRNKISPRLCAQHREEIMKQAQQKKDGHVVTSLDDAETIDKMVQQKQRENLVDLLNRKEAKKLEKSPRKQIKKLGRALSHRCLPTTKGRGAKMLTRQNSVRNKATFLPSTLCASHNCLPVRSDKVKTTTTPKEL